MRIPRSPTAATLAGLVVAVLAGCTGGTPSTDPTTTRPRAVVTTTPSPPLTPSAAPTADAEEFDASVPPEPPAGLQGPPSEEAAAEASEYFLSLFPYAFATGDLTTWKAMSADSCKYCAGTVEKVELEASQKKHRVGGRIEVLDVQAFHHVDQQYATTVRFHEHESQLIAADGTVEKDIDYVLDGAFEMLLTWTEHGWVIDGVDLKWTGKL